MLNEYYGKPELQHGFTDGLKKAGEALKPGVSGPAPYTPSKSASPVKFFLDDFIDAHERKPFKLRLQDVEIPETFTNKLKSNPRYNPALLDILIQKEILNPSFMGAEGFGISSTFTNSNVPRKFGRTF